MRKNTKAILVALCALVMALAGIGMPKAHAAATVDDLTVDYIFDSLGESLQYGVVAHRWEQANHAETSACVDELYKMTDTVFSNSDITYSYALDYSLTVDVTAPQDKTLQGMSFALFTYNGNEYVRCDESVAPAQSVTANVSSTTLEWEISGDLRNERLYVFQLDQSENGYVENGSENSIDLVVTYGPSISASAQNDIYLGKIIFPSEKGINTALGIFNPPYTHSPSLTLGGGVQLYSRGENDTMVALNVENLPADLNLGEVFVDYFYEADGQLKKAQMKLDDVKVKNGKFVIGGSEIDVKLDNPGENHVADTLLKDASDFSFIIGNMGGGEISDKSVPPKGPSTVTGPVGEDGTFVSIYDVEVGEDRKFVVKDDMGWLNDSRVDDKSKVGIPIQENEYVIINLICPSNDPDYEVTLAPGTSDITYFVEEGQTKGEIVGWAEGGNTDSGASQRVIFNFVYVDENGIMQPYQGTVIPNNGHGGTLLVPEGRVEVTSNVHNGGIIANEVYNGGQEIHQRTMKTQGRSTWVVMDGGSLTLEKVSLKMGGYGYVEGEPLPGAVFGVYSDEKCTNLVTEITTGADGKATSDMLAAGNYWVKEIKAPDGYTYPTDMWGNVINPAVKVTVIAGAEPTKVNGPGYQWGPTNIGAGKFVNMQDYNQYGDLRVEKLVAHNNEPLQDVEFGIYASEWHQQGYGGYWAPSGDPFATITTNRNGVAAYYDLRIYFWGNNNSQPYFVKELSAPDGYTITNGDYVEVYLKADQMVTVDGNGDAEGAVFMNEAIRGNIALKKVNAANSKITLEGAEFTVYSDKACTKIVGVMTTGENGIATSVGIDDGKDLLPGTYYVVETKAPEGYKQQMNTSVYPPVPVVYTVDVKYGKIVDVVTNKEIADASMATGIGNDQYIHISGTKNWFDSEFSSQRPQQVTIELYKKVSGATQETWINETKISGPEWKFEFKTDLSGAELPRYDENGKEIQYIIRENLQGNQYYYTFVKQNKDDNGNITATVANTIKTTKVVGSKKWEDNLNAEHPEKITFLLYVDVDGELTQVRSPYDSNRMYTVEGMRHENYRFTFENLPTYDVNGDPAKYVVKEADSDDYHVVKSVSESKTEGNQTTVTITLTNRLTVPLKGTKTWADDSNADGKRPENITLEIKQNGKPFPLTGPDALEGVEIIWDKETDPDVWTWKVVGLPKYDAAGNTYTYTATEKPMPGYKQEVNNDENGIHFINTLKGKSTTVTLPVTKELTTANEFIYLPSNIEQTFTFGIEADEATANLSGWRIVKDTVELEFNNAEPHTDAFSIVFTQKGTYTFEVKETSEGTGFIKADDTVYTVVYTVEEAGDNLTAVPTIKKGEKTADEVEFVNTYGSFSISGEKVWKDADTSLRLNVDEFSECYLELYTVDETGKQTKVTGYKINPEGIPDEPYLKVSKENDDCFYWNFYNLPAYDADGNALTYLVKELTVKGYQTFYVNNTGTGAKADGIYEEAPRPAVTSRTYSIYNTLAKATLNIEKTVEVQGDAQPDTLPEFQFTIEPKDTALTGYHFVDAAGKELTSPVTVKVEKNADSNIVGTLPVTILFDSFEGTEKEFAFIVKETGTAPAGWNYDEDQQEVTFTVMRNADDYTVTVDPEQAMASFTNTYKEEEKTSVTVEKVWHVADGDIAPAEKQYDVTDFLELYVLTPDSDGNEKLTLVKDVDGKALRPVQQLLSESKGTYDYTWSDLPKLKDGEQYVVKEDLEALYAKYPGYWVLYDYTREDYANAENGYLVSNHVFSADAGFVARKLVDGKVPEMAKGFSFVVKNLTTNEEHIFKNEDNSIIDVYIKYGPKAQPAPGKTTVYEYVMYEVDPEDGAYIYDKAQFKFQATIDINGKTTIKAWNEEKQAYVDELPFNAPAFTFNNKTATSVTVTKEWVGGNLKDSDLTNNLTLYANDTQVAAEPKRNGNVYTWTGLPMYDEDGKQIVYTVKEDTVPDGYVVTYLNEIGEDAGEFVPGDAACDGGKIVNTFYETKGQFALEGDKLLEGRDLKAGEFTFVLTAADGTEIERVTNDANGDFAFAPLEYTEADVGYGMSALATYYIYEVDGDLPGVTYDTREYKIELELQDNKAGDIIVKPYDGSMPHILFENTYEEKTYEAKGEVEFDGVKVLNGRDMKAGEFTFILTDKAGKELQRVTNKADGTFAFEPIKYTEKDVPYGEDAEFTYYITELAGDLPGVTYDTKKYEITVGLWDDMAGKIEVGEISDSANQIVFTNTYEAEGSVTFKGAKLLLGREFKQGDEFTFELLNEKGDVIDTVTINPTSGAKADFAFKTIKYELADAGKTYTYTYRVKEKAGNEEGMTYDDTVHTVTVKVSDAGNGELKVEASKNADALNFTNTYLAEGTVLFSGTKTMDGRALAGKDFTFVLTDAEGKEIERVTNDKDGKIVFSAIQYKLADAGKTFTYKVYEVNDKQTAVTYDETVYTVTVKVEDAGNGHLKATASDNATKLNFKNSYEAKAILTLNAFKTVNGYKPSVDQVYDFVLLCDDGTEMTAQNKDEKITFGTLTFDEDDIGKTFIYTVKETTVANELLDVDTAIYQVAVTVTDGGDGNLKLETEILKDGKRATGVVFANTATATLAISKTVKGPGPDKAFDLKVTFIGVDGKELEGVYDYDGDVKGTITSGGVIALKDGQSVTIVGLPEGATYTVEENAGPAYTVTVNGKPIAKAEGTLVGHGKLEFINTVEVTTFSVTKVWEGTDLGEITLTLYADGKQITPQPEVTREGNEYTYYNLPKYNDEGEEIVYSAKERGIDGYIRIYNNVEPFQKVTGFVHDGGTIINREIEEEVHELSFKIRKVWTGVEATEEIPAITLTLYCNGEKMDVPTPKPDSEGWYRYYDLPKSVNGKIAVYTVVEEPIPGYTVTYKTASGEIVEEGVNGGEIVNAKVPQTGDPATLGLWLALMGASAVLLTMLQRRRKA